MKRFVGETMVMRELAKAEESSDRYELWEGRGDLSATLKNPRTPGRYIEVKVIRNFRVTQVVDYEIEELG